MDVKYDVKYEHVIQEIGDMIVKKPRKKREPHKYKLVMINEEELIRQVEIRPMLYDKSLKGYRKSALRDQCWKEIAALLNSTVEECRKRWRSLRDAFAKHYKLSDVTINSKKKKWIFYDQMDFIAPFLDCSNSSQESAHISKLQDNSHESLLLNDENDHLDDEEISQDFKTNLHHHLAQQNALNSTTIIPSSTSTTTVTAIEHVNVDNLHHHSNHHHHHHQHSENSTTVTNDNTINDVNTTAPHISAIDIHDDNQFVARIFTTTSTQNEYDTTNAITTTTTSQSNENINNNQKLQQQQSNSIITNASSICNNNDNDSQTITIGTTPITSTTMNYSSLIIDPDERFLLSCAPILKRLSNKKNALARLKIQQILYNIEFDE